MKCPKQRKTIVLNKYNYRMDFLAPLLEEYVLANTREESPVLKALNRETNLKVMTPRMLAGHLQGRVLSMLSNMIRPEQILEIGTYTGYSAICLSEGLQKGGKIHTIDNNGELKEIISRYLEKAGITEKVNLYIGDAMEIIPSINEIFDLVYIDADKVNYSNYYDLVFAQVRKGGFIIADNALWNGKVLDSPEKMDEDTKAVVAYSRKVHADKRVENVIFPIRDGLMVCRKIGM